MKNIFDAVSQMREALQRAEIHDAETHSEVVRNLIDTVGALAATGVDDASRFRCCNRQSEGRKR